MFIWVGYGIHKMMDSLGGHNESMRAVDKDTMHHKGLRDLEGIGLR